MLIENEWENEDTTSLSHQFDSQVKINYDLKSLMKSEFVYDVDPELIDPSVSDSIFLAQQRKRAETKLIKSKIIYKQHSGIYLSPSEKKYLKKWTSEISSSQHINLLNVRDCMLPNGSTKLDINNSLSASDMFNLNNISNVSLNRDDHG